MRCAQYAVSYGRLATVLQSESVNFNMNAHSLAGTPAAQLFCGTVSNRMSRRQL